jgi:2-isopropylmalate synthase
MSERIIIFDTTLRDGEQAPGASMTIEEKVQIAHQLAQLGVDVLEAGFPVSSPAQFEAVQRITTEVAGPVTCALARTMEGDIRAAGEALAEGEHTRIHTFIATSDVHINAKFSDGRFGTSMQEKRASILRMAQDAVRQARAYTDDVEFSAEDAGRTDRGFLSDVVLAAVEAGATTINIPDTTGYCMPDEYATMIETVRDALPDPDAVTFSTHCHDDLGLAVANSLAGVRAGARQVECTINGIGERAGNAALEEIVMALRVRGDRYGVDTNINTPLLTETSKMVSASSGFPVQPNKAIVGRNAFSHEAGIHQHGVLKERTTYEIMHASDVGQEVEQIRLGRHSGRHGLFRRLEQMGFDVPEDQRDAIYQRFVDLADRKKEVFNEDLRRLMDHADTASSEAPPAYYELDHVAVSIDTHRKPEAMVRIRHTRGGAVREERATGEGPVDAIYRAIDHAVQEAHTLVDYTIRSISEGADAQGEVNVRVRHGENQFAGQASGTDVLHASAAAYVNALNHLAAFHADDSSVQFVMDGIMGTFNGDAEDPAQASPAS